MHKIEDEMGSSSEEIGRKDANFHFFLFVNLCVTDFGSSALLNNTQLFLFALVQDYSLL